MQKILRFIANTILTVLLFSNISFGQDEIRMSNIHTPQLFQSGNQMTYPVIALGKTNGLELDFDDFDTRVKNYSYTFQLCDADWQPVNLSTFDYINGFVQNRILNYQFSSIAMQQYVHYTFSFPASNCMPTKSGNYILKVFLDGDTSNLAFSKRFLVTDSKVGVTAQIQQPFDTKKMYTHQKVQFTIDNSALQITNPQQQIKVVVLQNYRWDNCVKGMQPAFMRGSQYEYNGERDFTFPAGKEFRWIDNSSFRFYSDRVRSIDRNSVPFYVEAVTDMQRNKTQYLPYEDYDGFYSIKAAEQITASTQGDYGNVHFKYENYDKTAFPDLNVYIVGQFNNYNCDIYSQLRYNADSGYYETNQLLKQGYYTYMYVTKPINNPQSETSFEFTEGSFWQTENNYTILVYFRELGGRYDQLVGSQTINSNISDN